MCLTKESDPTLGNKFWLPYIQQIPKEILYWIHSETGKVGNFTWRKGQVKLVLL